VHCEVEYHCAERLLQSLTPAFFVRWNQLGWQTVRRLNCRSNEGQLEWQPSGEASGRLAGNLSIDESLPDTPAGMG